MSTASLTLALAEYQDLLAARARAEQETAEVRAELAAAKLVDPTSTVAPLTAFARDCLTIARFAVANLPPEMIRSWPYEALIRLCENIHVLPDCSINDRDMALDLISFAHDCEAHEIRRRGEPKPTRFTTEEDEERRQRLAMDPIAEAAMARMAGGHA